MRSQVHGGWKGVSGMEEEDSLKVYMRQPNLYMPSPIYLTETGNVFSVETELKRVSTQGTKQTGGKWRNGVENMEASESLLHKMVGSLYPSPTHPQNSGRQLNFSLEIPKSPRIKTSRYWPFGISRWKGCLTVSWLYDETYLSNTHPPTQRISIWLCLISLRYDEKAEYYLRIFKESPQH